MSTRGWAMVAIKRNWCPDWLFNTVASIALATSAKWLALLVSCDCDRCMDNQDAKGLWHRRAAASEEPGT